MEQQRQKIEYLQTCLSKKACPVKATAPHMSEELINSKLAQIKDIHEHEREVI